jgi:RND superfamily putative drug exporter
MFERLGRVVHRLRHVVVAAWLAAAVAAVVAAPSLTDVGSADPASFLPREAASLEAQAALERAFPAQAAAGTATIAFWREGGLTDADRATIDATATWLAGPSAPAAVSEHLTGVIGATGHPELASMLRSSDGELELLQVQLSATAFQPTANAAVDAIRAHLRATVPADLAAYVTGSVGIGADYIDAIATATDRTTLVTVGLVVLVLLLIYRAPLAALVPLLTIGASYLVASGILALAGQAGWQLSSLLGTFVVVIVFGVGTDYTIFLISRFREEVAGTPREAAVIATVRRIGPVLAASAATVVIGLGSMVVGRFGLFQTTGPALAIAIGVTLVAGLTLSPALLAIFGRYLFWPRPDSDVAAADRGFFARLAGLIARRPLVVTAVVLLALAVPTIGMGGLRQSFDVLADLPDDADAKAGFETVADHFDAGRLMPMTVVVDGGSGSDLATPTSLAAVRDLTDRLVATEGVSRVESVVAPSGDGATPDAFVPSIQLATMAGSFVVPADPAGGLQKLLDPATAAGLESAARYLALLGPAYPEVATTDAFVGAKADLARLPGAIEELRAAARVSTQLEQMGRLLSLAAAMGRPLDDASLGLVTEYFTQLVAAYPDVTAHPAYTDLERALLSAVGPPDPARLAADVEALAEAFASQPDALLFPAGMSSSPAMTALREEMAAILVRLPVELDFLSATFAARPDDLFIPVGLEGDAGAAIEQALAAFVSDDRTVSRINVVTAEGPYSAAAFETFDRVRAVVNEESASFGAGARLRIGGQTAIQADLQATINDDFLRVATLTVAGVFLVLVVLLRSVVAPIYLVGTVLLSYLCTLGLMVTFFERVLGHAGINDFLPLTVFVLLVALGSDYNIFLMSRVREEAEARGTSAGIRAASARTGAVITSAGVILAGTFLAMVASPLTVLFQAGAIVAVGVLIDTFVVRSLLVPAITTVLGDAAWWPFGGRPAGRAGRGAPTPGMTTPAARPS